MSPSITTNNASSLIACPRLEAGGLSHAHAGRDNTEHPPPPPPPPYEASKQCGARSEEGTCKACDSPCADPAPFNTYHENERTDPVEFRDEKTKGCFLGPPATFPEPDVSHFGDIDLEHNAIPRIPSHHRHIKTTKSLLLNILLTFLTLLAITTSSLLYVFLLQTWFYTPSTLPTAFPSWLPYTFLIAAFNSLVFVLGLAFCLAHGVPYTLALRFCCKATAQGVLGSIVATQGVFGCLALVGALPWENVGVWVGGCVYWVRWVGRMPVRGVVEVLRKGLV